MGALVEEKDYGYDDREGSFKDHVHVSEEIEDEFQIYVLELYEFGVRDAVSTLLGHPERLGDEFASESAFYFDCEFMKEAFGVL